MSELEEIERDLREYLEKEKNLSRQDRLAYLMAIFAKRLEFNKLNHMVNYIDFFQMLDQARKNFVSMRVPVHITRKRLENSAGPQIALLEAFIGYLNKNDVLKKLVKFDYTE